MSSVPQKHNNNYEFVRFFIINDMRKKIYFIARTSAQELLPETDLGVRRRMKC